jgi:predicted dehydrogenase
MWRHLQIADVVKKRLGHRPVSLVAHTFINGPLLSPHLTPWFKLKEKSGGPVFDQAIHIIDVSRYVLSDVSRVVALGNNLVFPKTADLTIEDSLALLMEYESGTAGTYLHGWAHDGTSVSTRFVGPDFDLTAAWHDRILTGTDQKQAVHETFEDNSYHTEVRRFLHAVREDNPALLRSTYADAVKTLSVAWAAERSLQSGGLEETWPFHV